MNKKEIIDAAKALKDRHCYDEALTILKKIEPTLEAGSKPYTKLVRLRAECYYQNRELPANIRFTKALSILETLDPEEGETKRLKGAIYKRKYQSGKNLDDLYRAISYYETAAQDVEEDEGYGAVNAVYLYHALIVHLEDALDTEMRQMYESKIEQIITNAITHLEETYPSIESRQVKNREWISPTLAELYLSRYDYDKCNAYLLESMFIENGKELIEELIHTCPDLVVDIWKEVDKGAKIDYGMNRKRFTTVEQLIKLYDLLPNHHAQNNDDSLHAIFRGMPEEADIYNIILSVRIGKVGLALSGGGFRASLFHIGILHRLAELDILRHVQVISSVSGGSIVAMHYYLKLKRLLEENDNFSLGKKEYISLVDELENEFINGVQSNIRMKAFTQQFDDLTEELGRQYQQELYDRTGIDVPGYMNELLIHPIKNGKIQENFKPNFNNFELKNKVPIIIINATNLNNGHNWRFTATGMGESPYMYDTTVDKNVVFSYSRYDNLPEGVKTISIGSAVAASSAVPGLFDPISLNLCGTNIRLSDGGVYDNQGIAALLDAECDIVITSDASGQLTFEKNPSNFRFDVLDRIRDILMNKTRDSEFKIAKELRRTNRITGLSILHLKHCFQDSTIDISECQSIDEPDRISPCSKIDLFKTLDKDIQIKLAGIRTDLDAFHDLETYTLIQSGYEITTHWFETYGRDQKEWQYFDLNTPKRLSFEQLKPIFANKHAKNNALKTLEMSQSICKWFYLLPVLNEVISILIILLLFISIKFVLLVIGSIALLGIVLFIWSKKILKSWSNRILYIALRSISTFYLSYLNDRYLTKGKL